MRAAADPLFGRESELSALEGFLERIPNGAATILLSGEAGIGKTTLWVEALRSARARGCIVLACSPGELETKLAYSAVGDLLEDVLDDALRELPAPQRRALEHALLRAEDGETADQRAVSLAFLGAVRALARRDGLVLAIDDFQWLDASSARALHFAFRRLTREPVGVVVALRREQAEALPPPLRSLPIEEVLVGPLSSEALDRLLRYRLGTAFLRPALARLEEAVKGNPFFALELAAAVLRRGEQFRPSDPLPVPDNLRELLADRLALLPTTVRDTLLVVAAISQPTVLLVESTLDAHDTRRHLEQAVDAGVLALDRGRLHFAHPLVGSVVYSDAPTAQRQEVHRRLAGTVSDLEERARHLALATSLPDATAATALDAAAARANGRGAPDAAATFSEDAIRLTPPDDQESIVTRTLSAADHHLTAGETDRARELLQALAGGLAPDPTRARVLRHLARAEALGEGWLEADELLRRARNEVGADLALEALIERDLGIVSMQHGRLARSRDHFRKALAIADELDDAGLAADAQIDLATAEFQMGMGDPAAIAGVLSPLRHQTAAHIPTFLHHRLYFVTWAKYSDDFALARTAVVELIAELRQRHEEGMLGPALFQAGELECWAGNLELAEGYAREMAETAQRAGQPVLRTRSLYLDALVDAHLGRVDTARSGARSGLALAEQADDLRLTTRHLATLGFLELSVGDVAAAHEHLVRAREVAAHAGYGEPGMFRFAADAIESLIALGELATAADQVDELEEQGRRLDRPWALATAGRCRGLLAAASQDAEGAVAALDFALEVHTRLESPLELGRTMLALGVVHRRAKRKRPAREALEQALALCEQIPAPLWAARARQELARIGGRAPAPDGLTATEQQVANLVASGHTNREVADALFISAKTVEKHLTRIYEKVGVHSRRQLSRELGPR
jgi:DNA-binding CsgD family transcriptional regulator